MLKNLKNGKHTVQEIYSSSSQLLHKIKSLNAYVRVTNDMSQLQFEESTKRYLSGKFFPVTQKIPLA